MSISHSSTAFSGSDPLYSLTLVDLAERFGNIPATRICLDPPPGQATEDDLLRFDDHEDRLFELIEGTLIEKTLGAYESHIAGAIFAAIFIYLKSHPIGIRVPS